MLKKILRHKEGKLSEDCEKIHKDSLGELCSRLLATLLVKLTEETHVVSDL